MVVTAPTVYMGVTDRIRMDKTLVLKAPIRVLHRCTSPKWSTSADFISANVMHYDPGRTRSTDLMKVRATCAAMRIWQTIDCGFDVPLSMRTARN